MTKPNGFWTAPRVVAAVVTVATCGWPVACLLAVTGAFVAPIAVAVLLMVAICQPKRGRRSTRKTR